MSIRARYKLLRISFLLSQGMSRSIPSKIIFMCGLGRELLWSVNIAKGRNGGSSFPDSSHRLNKFAKYKPTRVWTFWKGKDLTSEAIIEFEGDLDGFMYAIQFEMTFENDGRSKKELEGCTENTSRTTIPRDK